MKSEILARYDELKKTNEKLMPITDAQNKAWLYKDKMEELMLTHYYEVGGATYGQAGWGFLHLYDDFIKMIGVLTANTVLFLENIGASFESADTLASKEIEK